MELADHLRVLLAERRTLAEASATLGKSRSILHRLADELELPRRRRALAPERARAIDRLLAEGRTSISRIARIVGVSKSTVSKIANRELNAAPGFRPRRLRRARLCPKCRANVWLWPCVACAAREMRTEPPRV